MRPLKIQFSYIWTKSMKLPDKNPTLKYAHTALLRSLKQKSKDLIQSHKAPEHQSL